MRSWVLVLSLAACRAGPATPLPAEDASRDAEAVAPASSSAPVVTSSLDGAELYASLCAVCHGADGKGYKADQAPSLVNKTFLESATDDQLRRSIVDGRPGTSMAAYGKERGGPLDVEAVGRLVGWIRGQGPALKAIPPAGAGDAARGAPLYATHCEKCHGNATSRGNSVHLANPRFLEAFGDPFLRYAIVNGRPGTPMEAWQAKLKDAQIDDVVAFVRSLDKSQPAGSLPPPTGKEPLVINPRGREPAWKPRADPCPPTVQSCTNEPRYVAVDQVKKALEEKRKMIIIDARPPSDWMRVHIPGAVSIPYHDLKRLDEVPNDGTWVVAYCACPHHLSGDVVDALKKRGNTKALILDEGILDWHRKGYPVIAAPGVTPPPAFPPMFAPPQPLPMPPFPPPPSALPTPPKPQ